MFTSPELPLELLDLAQRAQRYETALREIGEDNHWNHACRHSAKARETLKR